MGLSKRKAQSNGCMHLYSVNNNWIVKSKLFVCRLLIMSMVSMVMPIHQLQQSAQAADIPANQWVDVPLRPDPILSGLNIPNDAYIRGMWSGTVDWPIVAVQGVLMPDGRVLSYGTNREGELIAQHIDIWDPLKGFGVDSHETIYRPDYTDSFCAVALYLNDGKLMISGGSGQNGKSNILFNASNNSVVNAPGMANNRWYSTMLMLPDGRPIMLGGMVPWKEDMVNNPTLAIQQGLASMTPELYENGNWRSLFGASSREAFGPDNLRTSYPRAWVAPDGQVFGVSADKMWKLDPNANGNNGAITYVGNFKGVDSQGNPISYNGVNPVNVGTTNTAVMYDIGKLLIIGGNGGTWSDGLPASDMVTAIDINGGMPVTEEKPRMSKPRRLSIATVLANGDTVVLGGTEVANRKELGVNFAEIWRPSTNQWTVGASASIFRGYHGNATLMPNGTILAYGGGWVNGIDLTVGLKAEFYYPPYLFTNQNGTSVLAPRPVIRSISGLTYKHNAPIQLDTDKAGDISQLVLVGLSNSTHAFNAGQRRIPLNFSQEGVRVSATIPNANLTPPGYYQVVVLNNQGVPSLGTIISVGQDVTLTNVVAEPVVVPTIPNSLLAPITDNNGISTFSLSPVSGLTYSWNFGDGTPDTPFSANPTVQHVFAKAGLYYVTVTARNSLGTTAQKTFFKAVATAKTANQPSSSSSLRLASGGRLWVVNPYNDSVSVVNASNSSVIATIPVGQAPRAIAVAPNGNVWVTNKKSASISVINANSLSVINTIQLPKASQPFGLVFSPDGVNAYVVLEAKGQLIKLNTISTETVATIDVGSHPRNVSITADGATLLVSRFITAPLPGESTVNVDTSNFGGEVLVINANAMEVRRAVILRHSDKLDSPTQGSGVPNYLGAAAISPDGMSAWVPSKQDNIKRGKLRNGLDLDFQNTIRAISSQINLIDFSENYARRVDHDNSSLASAALYHHNGIYLFVALETSRQVAVVDAVNGVELFKIDVGRAPQGLALSEDGLTLYVHEFMDRSVGVVDLRRLLNQGELIANVTTVVRTVNPTQEKLAPSVVLGKQFFYDAKDQRLSRDGYMSCASCHNDGGHDGRVWDISGFGEGLRNTISLKGKAGLGHGFLHWSANFDEVQDFEKQIRDLAGGLGLMSDAQFNAGTRNQALGDKKAGVSADLDLLATYVGSLNTFDGSPFIASNGEMSSLALQGKQVFDSKGCVNCHAGTKYTASLGADSLKNIGTIKPSSGARLSGALQGIDIPTLLDAWDTAPYLHDGSASTLQYAIRAHNDIPISDAELNSLAAFIKELGSNDAVAIGNAGNTATSAISIYSPTTSSNYRVGGNITIAATVSNITSKVARVEFYDGNTLIKVTKSKPYKFTTKKLAEGVHSLNAKVVHKDNTFSTSTTINVSVGQVTKRLKTNLPDNAILCANDKQTCNPQGNVTVWYGYKDKWLTMPIVSGSVACNIATFGSLSTSKPKKCWYVN